jgi:DNA-binding response OmpR family regulator
MTPQESIAEIMQLRRENEALRAVNTRLRNILAPSLRFPAHLHLPRREQRALSAILAAAPGRCTRERLYEAIYFDANDGDPPDTVTIESHVSKVRKKIAPLEIHSERYLGYWMTAADAKSLSAMLLQDKRELAA